LQRDTIAEADIRVGMNGIILAVNKLTTKSSVERRTFLTFLWACYDSLPPYVNSDPSKCNFSACESSGVQYDQYGLYSDLGSAISSFLCANQPTYSFICGGEEHIAKALSGDGKRILYIFS
jgi:hypothetical protein